MSFLKTVFAITAQNFRKWQTDYRIWTIAALMIILTLIYADDVKQISDFLNTEAPVWIFPFMYSQYYTKALYTLPVVLMFCDAPFIDRNQVFVMMRTTRMKWLCGQVLYIISAGAVYYLFLLFVSLLPTVFRGGFSLDWGAAITAEAFSYVSRNLDLHYISISRTVVEYFTPLIAVFYTFILSWLGAVFLGLMILLLNVLTSSRIWGITVSSVFVVLSITAEKYSRLLPFSPISWTTLNYIDVGKITRNPSITYVLTSYAVLIISLTAAIFLFCGKKNPDMIEIKGE